MFIEKKKTDALKDFINGFEVVVMCKFDDGSIMCEELKNLFAENARFLVDIPEKEEPKQPAKVVVEDKQTPEPEEPAKEPQKSKKQIIRELIEEGMSNQKIIKQTGFNPQLIYQVRYEIKKEKGEYPTRA